MSILKYSCAIRSRRLAMSAHGISGAELRVSWARCSTASPMTTNWKRSASCNSCCILRVRILSCSREKYARVRPHSERTQVEEVLSGLRRATVALALVSRALGSEQIGSVSCHGHDQVAHLRVLRLEVNG